MERVAMLLLSVLLRLTKSEELDSLDESELGSGSNALIWRPRSRGHRQGPDAPANGETQLEMTVLNFVLPHR